MTKVRFAQSDEELGRMLREALAPYHTQPSVVSNRRVTLHTIEPLCVVSRHAQEIRIVYTVERAT